MVLDRNQITILPTEVLQLQNLQELYLSENQFTSLPKEIGQLKNLQRLELDSNPLSSKEKEKVVKLLPNCEIDFEGGGE